MLLYLVTLGIYGFVYYYKTHEEIKIQSGQGLGGTVALLLAIFVGAASPFLLSSEVGGLYARRGQAQPVSALLRVVGAGPSDGQHLDGASRSGGSREVPVSGQQGHVQSFGQRDVGGVVDREVVSELPAAAQQLSMAHAVQWEIPEIGQGMAGPGGSQLPCAREPT